MFFCGGHGAYIFWAIEVSCILHKLPWNRRGQSVGDGEPQPVLDWVKHRFSGRLFAIFIVYRCAKGLEFRYGLGRRRVLR